MRINLYMAGDNLIPKISIILPNYNSEKYLKETIESVLSQTYQDFELIIVDDASTDKSMEIARSFQDPRIKYIQSDRNRQVAYTANIGMEMAEGEYIARIDSDDIWDEKKLEIQLKFMEENMDIAACFTRVDIIDENSHNANKKYQVIYDIFEKAKNRSQKEWLGIFLTEGNCLCHSSVFMRKEFFKDIGGFYNLAYVGAEDYELWVRMVIRHPIYVLDDRLVKYRWEEHSATKISGLTKEKVYMAINLQMMLKSHLFEYMTDEEFVRYFKDTFINKEAEKPEELECEKAFYLLRCSGKDVNFLGLQSYAVILNQPKILNQMEKKQRFLLTEFYDLLKVRNFGIPGELEEREEQVAGLQEKLKKSEESAIQLQKLLRELQHEVQMHESKEKCLNDKLNKLKKEYAEMVHEYEYSKSWRITKPLRKISTMIEKSINKRI